MISPKPKVISRSKPTIPELRAVISQPAQKRRDKKRGNEGVLVRLPPELLAKLDAALDGRTRPEAIRAILEKTL